MLGPAFSTWSKSCVGLHGKQLHLLGQSAGKGYIGSVEDVGGCGWFREASLLRWNQSKLFRQSLSTKKDLGFGHIYPQICIQET